MEEDDFGRHLIPAAIEKLSVFAHTFDGYWEDIGTIPAFYRANMRLTDLEPPFQFHDPDAPIFTHPRYLAGSRLVDCRLDRVIVGEGCSLRHAEVEQSVVGVRSQVGPGVRISQSVVMGADLYETADDRARNRARGEPDIGIGAGSVIHRAIVDKNARIGRGVTIGNDSRVRDADGGGHFVREGIVVVPKDGVIPDGTRI